MVVDNGWTRSTSISFISEKRGNHYYFFAKDMDSSNDLSLDDYIINPDSWSNSNIVEKPIEIGYDSEGKELLVQYLLDTFQYINEIVVKNKMVFPTKEEICGIIRTVSDEYEELCSTITGNIFTENIESYSSGNGSSSTNKLTYMASLIICLIYTGKYPSELWLDIEERRRFKTIEFSKKFQDGISNSVIDDNGITLITRQYEQKIDPIINHVVTGVNIEPLLNSGIPKRLAEFLCKILIYTDDKHVFKNLWETARLPVKREDTVFAELDSKHKKLFGIKSCAGSSYAGIKHIKTKSSCEDCCGSGFVDYSTKTKKWKSKKIESFYIFVADGVSGSSKEISGKKISTTALGASCTRDAIEYVAKEISKIILNEENPSESIRKYLDNHFPKTFYTSWVSSLEKALGKDYSNRPSDYTATFLGVIICGGWAIIVKIGNGSFIISNGKSEKSFVSINDNCNDSRITGSVSKSIDHPDYWNCMIMPSNEVKSILLSSDGADSLLNGRKIKYNNLCVNCDYSEMPYFSKLIEELKTKDNEYVSNYIDSLVKETSVNAKYLGSSNGDDDVTIAFASFES